MSDPADQPASCNKAFAWLDRELAQLDAEHLRRQLKASDRVAVGGSVGSGELQRDGAQLVNFGSNDYLGLASDPRLASAANQAASEAGWGSGASPLVTGRTSWHAKLERRIAEFEGAEAALVFPTGFAANAGVIPALVDEGDLLLADAKNHASLIDGCRLARAERKIYPHNDVAELERLLKAGDYRRRLIVTDSLFSMDGDVAPLAELARLANEHDAMLLVDEAHATGVWGKQGRGLVEHFAAEEPALKTCALIQIGTLSKGLGSHGGFVTGSQSLIDWLANRARTYVFSTAQPAALAAASLAAIDIVQEEPHRRTALHQMAAEVRTQLSSQGWELGDSSTQIIPIYVGEPERATQLSHKLAEQGLLVPGIRPPTVPRGESLLRISLSFSHSPEQIDRLLSTLESLTQ